MTSTGLEKVEIAKNDGLWSFLNDIGNSMVPEDLKEALNVNPSAKINFGAFSNSVKKTNSFWIKTASPETKIKRIKKVVMLAAENKKLF